MQWACPFPLTFVKGRNELASLPLIRNLQPGCTSISSVDFFGPRHPGTGILFRNRPSEFLVLEMGAESPKLPATVVVQVASIIVHRSQATDYLEHVHTTLLPTYRAANGLVSVCFSRRELLAYVEILAVSTWLSGEALRQFSSETMPPDAMKACALQPPHVYELFASCSGSGSFEER